MGSCPLHFKGKDAFLTDMAKIPEKWHPKLNSLHGCNENGFYGI